MLALGESCYITDDNVSNNRLLHGVEHSGECMSVTLRTICRMCSCALW
jgi:hypothetical protein